MTDKKIMEWDQHAMIEYEVDRLLKDDPERFTVRDETWDHVAEDQDFFTCEWEYLMEYLTEKLEELNPDAPWYGEVSGFGWRGLDGYAIMYFEDGEDFIHKVLPKADNTFYIYGHKDGLKVNNRHHDSPVGREWYFLTPLRGWECQICGEQFDETGDVDQEERDFIVKRGMCMSCSEELDEEIQEIEEEIVND